MIEFWHDTSPAASAWWSLRWVLRSWWNAEPCLSWRPLDFQGWKESWVCVNIYALWSAALLFLVVTSLFTHTRRPPSPASLSWLCGPAWRTSWAKSGPSSAPCASRPAVARWRPARHPRCGKPCRLLDQTRCGKTPESKYKHGNLGEMIFCEILTPTCPLFCLC